MSKPFYYPIFLALFKLYFRLKYAFLRLKRHFLLKSTIHVDVRARTFDKDGKETFNTGWIPSKSLVIQFLEILYSLVEAIAITITLTTGAEDSWSPTTCPRVDATATQDALGIIVGTGSTPVDNEDYALETPIAHGVGAGQLQYGAVATSQPSVVGSNVDFVITRTLTNASDGTINITEVGMYFGEGGNSNPRCVAHDLLSIQILDTASATVEYRIRTTV